MSDDFFLVMDHPKLAEAIIQDADSFEHMDDLTGRSPSSRESALALARREGLGVSSLKGRDLGGDRWEWEMVRVDRTGIVRCQFVGPSVAAAKALVGAKGLASDVEDPKSPKKTMATREDTL